jgi:hypothetical protein
MLFSGADFRAASFASCRGGEASRFAPVSRRSEAGRFAYKSPPSPTRRYADTASFVVAASPRYVICGLFSFPKYDPVPS